MVMFMKLALLFFAAAWPGLAMPAERTVKSAFGKGISINGEFLENGLTVFSSTENPDHFLSFNGDDIGFISRKYIRCKAKKVDKKYPL